MSLDLINCSVCGRNYRLEEGTQHADHHRYLNRLKRQPKSQDTSTMATPYKRLTDSIQMPTILNQSTQDKTKSAVKKYK